jgi:restriction system protein
MSDTEFEKYIASIAKLISNKERIECEVKHNHIAKVDDGNYQIDVIVKHTFLGSDNITLIECKKYKNPVPREKVEILYSRINSIGAHKGMLFSTSRFQEGAITFAKKHGIALVQVIDGKLQYEVRSIEEKHIEIPSWVDLPKYSGVAIAKIENGITCSYITPDCSDYLLNFILDID